jgi:Putative zinc-finger
MTARKAAARILTNRTCKEITDLIFGYLNDTLSRSVKRDFQRHLRVCPDCVNFLNTYKKTVATSRSLRPEEISANVRDNILDFLRKRIRKSPLSS